MHRPWCTTSSSPCLAVTKTEIWDRAIMSELTEQASSNGRGGLSPLEALHP